MKILLRARAFFTLLVNSFQAEAKNLIEPAIQITQTFKNVIDSPALDLTVALSRTPIDNAILKKLRAAIPDVIKKLTILKETANKKPAELAKEFIETMRTYPTEGKSAIYFKMSSLFVSSLDKTLKESERDVLVQLVYVSLKQENNLVGLEVLNQEEEKEEPETV